MTALRRQATLDLRTARRRVGASGWQAYRLHGVLGSGEIEYEPAFDLPCFDQPMRFDGLCQREDALDARRDPACFEQLEEG